MPFRTVVVALQSGELSQGADLGDRGPNPVAFYLVALPDIGGYTTSS